MSYQAWIISGSVAWLYGVRAAIVGFLLNILALHVICRTKFLNSLVDSCLKSILIVNFVSCVHITLQPVTQIGHTYYYRITYDIACGLATLFVFPIPGMLYSAFVTLIAVDCYSEIVRKLRFVLYIRKHRIRTVLLLWASILCGLITPAYFSQCWYTDDEGENDRTHVARQVILWITTLLFNSLPCLITLYCYVSIWKRLRQAEFALSQQRQKVRVLIIVTGLLYLNLVLLIAMEITEIYIDAPEEHRWSWSYIQLAFWDTFFDTVGLSLCVGVLPVCLVMLDPDLRRKLGSLRCCCRRPVSVSELLSVGSVRFHAVPKEDDLTPLVPAEELEIA